MTRAFDQARSQALLVRLILRRDDTEMPEGFGLAVILEPYTWADFAADPRVPQHVQANGSVAIEGVPIVCGRP